MRALTWGALVLAVAGCQPVTGWETSLEVSESNFTEDRLVGRAFGRDGVAIRGGTTETVDAQVELSSPLSATMQVDGEATSLNNFGGTSFKDFSGFTQAILATRLAGGPVTEDVIYMLMEDRPAPFFAGPRTIFAVDGDRTATALLPSGQGTYRGVVSGATDARTSVRGTIDLRLDFAAGRFDADLFGLNASDDAMIFEVDGGSVTGAGFVGTITGGDAVGGALRGGVYGDSADQAAGTVLISRPAGSIVGMFGAVD